MRLESQDYSDQLKPTYTTQARYIFTKYLPNKKEKKKNINMGYTIHPLTTVHRGKLGKVIGTQLST